MHTRTLKRMACLLAALTLTLTACRGPEADPAAELSPEARARTVPIVRSFKLVPMEEPLVVEFEAPKPSPNASPQLAVTVRVRESGPHSSAVIRDQITRLGLAAEIHLVRLKEGQEIPVRLARFVPRPDGAPTAVDVGTDGIVPGAEPYTVDISSLIDSGIIKTGETVRTLAFAWAPDAEKGTYRLSLRLINPPEEVGRVDVELLVAYQFRYK